MDTVYKEMPVDYISENELSFNGTILIPDISGFTKFVDETEFSVGREIIKELLTEIISSNSLDLHISEIEGDAVLFYAKTIITPIQIKQQYEIWLKNFQRKKSKLADELGIDIDLSLKLIAHYGRISTYKIGSFEKLYGKTVIEAHRLLKNTVPSNTYVLITENIFKSDPTTYQGTSYAYGSEFCEIYGNIEKIGFCYFSYETDDEARNVQMRPSDKTKSKMII
jgi:hypothetical protein